ncbi:hypothetical protein [Sphingomonas nostoxanthinifaciens]|uniref:hypothetical protein n=1 Tax=Sphingomonas nostoxanthinifaciens TaxID=2872652 RepID=UPI001CC1FFC5|nr:hypothetical protein [Sphingomonas nostoxanthinifaciens]UAK26125.1 hypothetical protein K8P63_08500 [Sphingomonas nostoxanthinifaciens]
MRPAADQQSSYLTEASPRRRAIGLIFAVIANLALLLLLLTLSPSQIFRRPPGGVRTITYALPNAKQQSSAARSASVSKPHVVHESRPPVTPPPIKPPVIPLPQQPAQLTGLLPMTKEEIAQADISKLPNHSDERAGGSNGAATGATGESDTSYTTGPGGEKLYAVEWYREPTDAELHTYMPRASPGSWGEIMCQTIERFHVDNCRELADSPPGSGLARGMREAAFQFLVRPPRIGGHILLGTWVRIRITFADHPREQN